MANQIEIKGEFLGLRKRWDENVIGHLKTEKEIVTFKGPMPEDDMMQVDLTYRLYGKWKDHPKYGRQFHCGTFIRAAPHGRRGTVRYLQTAPHIGQVIAERLYDKLQSDAVRILREKPDVAVAAAEIPSFTEERAEEASQYLQQESELEGCFIDLLELFSKRGFPKDLSRRLVKDWGNRAAQAVKEDPYLLLEYPGCGFAKTDKLYLDLGGDPAAPRRQTLCIWYELTRDNEGHAWFPIDKATQSLEKHLAGADANPVAAVERGREEKLLETRRDRKRLLWLAEAKASQAEGNIAEIAASAIGQAKTEWPVATSLSECSGHQQQTLASCLVGGMVVLGGSPGTGKSFAAAACIRRIVERHGRESVAVCAPTGRAASRMTGLLHEHRLRLTATTIHQLLGVRAHTNRQGWAFNHTHGNPLPHRFIIVDESSMIDASLMSSLLLARAPQTQLLFIGDVNQLPPVGRGAPLRDLIAAGVPYGELREPQRNGGTIVRCCAAIRDGQPLIADSRIDLTLMEPANLKFLHAANPQEINQQLLRGIDTARQAGFDPVRDVQVVTAVNCKSPVGRRQLNRLLQAHINTQGVRVGDNPFLVGDKIVCLKNGFVPSLSLTEPLTPSAIQATTKQAFVANGELAEVVAVEPLRTIARLGNPDRLVVIPRSCNTEPEDTDGDALPVEDAITEAGTGCSWDLGYALSVHKSQGSEWPLVLVVVDDSPAAKRVCRREWIYTAISRAKTLCLPVGQYSVAEGFRRRPSLAYRKTFLAESIQEHIEHKKHMEHIEQKEHIARHPESNLNEGQEAGCV